MYTCPICKAELLELEDEEDISCSFCGIVERAGRMYSAEHYHCKELRLATKIVRLDAYVTSPPITKCKANMAIFGKMLVELADKIWADIYYAGELNTVISIEGYRKETGKIWKIPSVYVNGLKIASQELPAEETHRKSLIKELNK
ncbi:MAG: hypothetical protein PWR20_1132 [Bacteroidales bacterium]|jgi:hypothetical protein|nr:hypothetical protein [Bacteroidales bacterium]MDN5330175.1 hypothetical protein [Bacteroidales bacterium]